MTAPSQVVEIRPTDRRDRGWLLRAGWARELVGRQYHWVETPLQVVIGPLRAWGRPPGPSYVIEVDGRRAGYIGRNPLSGHLEYWLESWARGGAGRRAIALFLADWRMASNDDHRSFSIARSNERSLAALQAAFGIVGWIEGRDFARTATRHGWKVTVYREPRSPVAG